MTLLTIDQLNIEFRESEMIQRVVSDVSFEVKEGEILGLVGESGSGKTITSLAIAGLLSRHDMYKAGHIYFNDVDILNCNRTQLRGLQGKEIGIIFQEPMTSLNPVKKIGWQVEESLRIHTKLTKEERYNKAIEALIDVELAEPEKIYHKYPHELSGGMRQRVMIAAAMILEPKLLIADEPTTALDVTVQEQIVALLSKLNKQKRTAIIFISHDLSLVQKLCHNICVMKEGKIVEKGTARQLFEHPKHEYTQTLIKAIPNNKIVEKHIKNIDNNVIVARNVSVGYETNTIFRKKGNEKIEVLKDISFTLKEGEILGIVGESGSGKSTLAKAILNIITHEGSLIINDLHPQMIFQDPYSSLNPAKKIGWILEEPLKNNFNMRAEERAEKVDEMLCKVGLDTSYKNRYPKELSGGQRQRISIAHALMLGPKLMIADEPVSALDVTIQKTILQILEQLQKETNCGIIFISHDLRIVQKLCHNIAILKNGRIIEYGNVYEIYHRPKEAYTKELLKASGFYLEEDNI